MYVKELVRKDFVIDGKQCQSKDLYYDSVKIASFDASTGFLNVEKINAFVVLSRPQREMFLESYNLEGELHVLKFKTISMFGEWKHITISVTQDEYVVITEEE